jgi:hypothetical protein
MTKRKKGRGSLAGNSSRKTSDVNSRRGSVEYGENSEAVKGSQYA